MAKEAGYRYQPRQGYVPGRTGKKELAQTRLREWIKNLQT